MIKLSVKFSVTLQIICKKFARDALFQFPIHQRADEFIHFLILNLFTITTFFHNLIRKKYIIPGKNRFT